MSGFNMPPGVSPSDIPGNEREFTDKQIADWRAYERIRSSGKFNMFDPRARKATELTLREYRFCRDNYSALRDQAEASR